MSCSEPAFPPGTPEAAFVLAHARGLSLERCWRLAKTAGGLPALVALCRQGSVRGVQLPAPLETARLHAAYQEQGSRCLRFGADDYPPRLYHLPEPPLLLFLRGDVSLLQRPAIAMVGTRRPDEYGLWVADTMAAAVAGSGWLGLSGLASGVDGRVHRQLLDRGGLTGAVLGTGLERVYPAEHGRLQATIGARGVLLTEYLPGTPVRGFRFPRRNRILAALAEVVLIIQAGERSGALNTAGQALALGRDVWCVPADIRRTAARGSNRLLSDGARPVLDGEDLRTALRELHPERAPKKAGPVLVPPPPGAGAEGAAGEPAGARSGGMDSGGLKERLLAGIGEEPRSAGALAAESGAAVEQVLAALVRLELEGSIVYAGGGYRRRS